MFAREKELGIPDGVSFVELYNGSSRDNENRIAIDNAEKLGYRGSGGRDAHTVSHIGQCAIKFTSRIETVHELVEALSAGEFEAITLKDSL